MKLISHSGLHSTHTSLTDAKRVEKKEDTQMAPARGSTSFVDGTDVSPAAVDTPAVEGTDIVNADGAAVDGAASTDGAKAKKPRTAITVATNIPLDMKPLIDKLAEDAKVSTSVWLRNTLAGMVNYTLPAETVRKGRNATKYAGLTPEAKAEAVAKDQADKRNTASALLRALEAGDLNVDLAEILAKYKPQPRATKAKTDDAPAEAAAVADGVS